MTTLVTVMILGSSFCLNANSQGAMPDDMPELIDIYIKEVAEEFDLSPYLLKSLLYQESGLIVTENLSQITNKKWFKEGFEHCGSDDIKNQYVNIRVCGYYLHKWYEQFGDECPYLILECWNEGPGKAVATHNCNKPSRYAKTIVDRAIQWQEEQEGEFKDVQESEVY